MLYSWSVDGLINFKIWLMSSLLSNEGENRKNYATHSVVLLIYVVFMHAIQLCLHTRSTPANITTEDALCAQAMNLTNLH
jgi:hypothetical protein